MAQPWRPLRLLALVLWVLASCGAPQPPAPPPIASVVPRATRETPCEAARAERARVPGLLAQGKLERTLRVLAKANALCAEEAPSTWGDEVETLAAIGRYEGARALADTIATSDRSDAATRARAARAVALADQRDVKLEATDAAKAPMRALYLEAARLEQQGEEAHADHDTLMRAKDKYVAAWEAWRPNGQALVGAGLCAKQAARTEAERAEAQRLFDRAVEDLKRATGAADVHLEASNGFAGVSALAWSAKLLAVADDRDIVVFDRFTWRPKYRLQGHEGTVNAVAFSPDGQLLASGSSDRTVRVWTPGASTPPLVMEGHADAVQSVAFSSSGELVASGSDDNTVRVWALSSTAPPLVLSGHIDGVKAVAFRPQASPDVQVLASGSRDMTVRLWTIPRAAWPRVDQGGTSPTGLRIAAAFSGNAAADLRQAGASVVSLSGHTDWVTSLAFSPDGKTLASGSLDDTIALWTPVGSVGANDRPRLLRGHTQGVRSISFSPDGKVLASGSSDSTIRLWPLSGGPARVLTGHPRDVVFVAFSPDGKTLASIGLASEHARDASRSTAWGKEYDNAVRLWPVDSKGPPRTLREHTREVTSVALSRDSSTLAFGARDGAVRVYTAGAGSPRVLPGTSAIESLALSSDGQMLATGARDGRVMLWSLGSSATPRVLSGHTGVVQSVAFSPDGRRLASASMDKTVRVWPMQGGAEPLTFADESSVESVAFSADSSTLAVGSWDGTIETRVLSSGGHRYLQGHTSRVRAVTFSPDGKTLVSGSDDRTIRFWRLDVGMVDHQVREDVGPVTSLAFAPDGDAVVSGSDDGTVRLWTLTSGASVRVFQGHTQGVTSVAFAGAGDRIVSGSVDGSVLVWSTKTGALLLTLRASQGTTGSYAFTPDGYITPLGEDVRQHPACRVGPLTYPVDVCEERFVVPELVAKVMAGDDSYREP